MELCKNENCTGCGACENSCIYNAIHMIENEDGFLIPQIDRTKCKECGICQGTCPIINVIKTENGKVNAFAVKASLPIREKSSSGGAFLVLAEYIIVEKGGYVCAAAWKDSLSVEHIIINNVQKLDLLCGSKYIQSKVGLAYRQIKELLENKKTVLFVGTPCQNAGLLSFLGNSLDLISNLYLVDLICRGVPSGKVLNLYLDEFHHNKPIESISFRDKSYYRWSEGMTIKFKSGDLYREVSPKDPFMGAYEKGYSLRSSCGDNCIYNQNPRCSDLTLGDFWAVGDYDYRHGTRFFDNLGTSIVTINSSKGNELIDKIRNGLELIEPVMSKDATHRNCYSHPMVWDRRKRNLFFQVLNRYGFRKAYEVCIDDKKDIALLGLWNGSNYGAIISANALYETMTDMGYIVEFIDTSFSYGNRNDVNLRYITGRCNISKKYDNISEMYMLNDRYDTFVVGSDQCFNSHISSIYQGAFLLPFARGEKKKISYSTSFGAEKLETAKNRDIFMRFLSEFDAVSVREKSGVKLCEELSVKAVHLLDPILIRPIEKYIDEIKGISIYQNNYSMSYLLDLRPNTFSVITEIEKRTKLENVKLLGMDYTNPWDFNIDNCFTNYSVYELIAYIYRSNYVVTDSYHGMCLAILFNKPFTVIMNRGRGEERFSSLLEMLGLMDRIINLEESFTLEHIDRDIAWNKVNTILSHKKADALSWLKSSLNEKKTYINSEKDYVRSDFLNQKYVAWRQYERQRQFERKLSNPVLGKMHDYFDKKIEFRDFVVIRGGGRHTKELLECIGDILARKEIDLLIMDKNPENIYVGEKCYQVNPVRENVLRTADKIIVSTWRYRREVTSELWEIAGIARNKVIDFYETLELNQLHPFYVDENWREY